MVQSNWARALLTAMIAIGVGSCRPTPPAEPADTIFVGDNIVTMDPAQPSVEAVAVRGETIVAAGSNDDVMALRGESTRVVNLGETALLPGFIDAHGHFLGVGQGLDQLSLHPPPVGDVNNIDDIVAKIQRWIQEKQIPPGQPVFAVGYDDSLIEEGRHPNRYDLDRASTEHPIVLSHVSGHFNAANSMALAASNITAATPDPEGGHIRRVRGSREPDGVLEERAQGLLEIERPESGEQDLDALVRRSIGVYTSYGTTTVQNGGGTSPQTVEAIRAAAARQPLDADLVLFTSAPAILEGRLQHEPTYRDGVRVAGVKFALDGSPQGRTAWVTRPYDEGPPGAASDYRAYPTMDPDQYKASAKALWDPLESTCRHASLSIL